MPDAADIQALRPAVEALLNLGIEFYVGGSVASNIYGRWRSTMDTDLVAVMRAEHVAPLVARLSDDYYIDDEMILVAIREQASFNIIHNDTHNDTAQKIDIFIAKRRAYDLTARARARPQPVSADGQFQLPVAAAEDVILSKLEWYRLGGEISERQWLDILGVMKVQSPTLDRAYLDQWAKELQVDDLLARAWKDAGE